MIAWHHLRFTPACRSRPIGIQNHPAVAITYQPASEDSNDQLRPRGAQGRRLVGIAYMLDEVEELPN